MAKKGDAKDEVNEILHNVAKQLVFNILQNAKYVLDACKCKTLKPSHLKAVSMIQAGIMKNKVFHVPSNLKTHSSQSGGAVVLPSEYFGVNSGRYLDINDVSGSQINLYGDSTLTRVEHPIIVGGGRTTQVIPETKWAQFVKDYMTTRKQSFRISREALQMIETSVTLNLEDLIKACGKSMTAKSLRTALSKKNSLIHLKA